ncbi:MAG TPA: hypothetical protein VGE59_01310 [Patescibacteria group bacterium]
MDKGILSIIGVTIIAVGIVFAVAVNDSSKEASIAPRDKCVEHAGLGMHIHPELEIRLEGQTVALPANIGVTSSCMHPLHTHDDSGKVHVEYPQKRDFQLGDFFAVWNQPFSKSEILDKKVDETHTLTVTVDGALNEEYEKLVLKDGQKIVIDYHAK